MLQAVASDANPFAVLSFLVAPAVLTNASALLALSTSNRIARASDRARAAAAIIFDARNDDHLTLLAKKDFDLASRRAHLLVDALRYIYIAGGLFAAGTCVALLGAFGAYFRVAWAVQATEILTIIAVGTGIVGLVRAALCLIAETRVALQVLDEHHAAITQWRATHTLASGAAVSPTTGP